MKRGLKYSSRCVYRTFYVDLEAYEKAREYAWKSGKSLNECLNEWLREFAQKSEGTPIEEINYERLKREFLNLTYETNRLVNAVKESGDYDELMTLVFSLGLSVDLSNLDQIIPKLMEAWKGSQESLHIFIDLMEISKRKRDILKILTEIRMHKYLSNQSSDALRELRQKTS